MMSKQGAVLISMSIILGGLLPAAKAIDIVKDGRAVAVIVADKAGEGFSPGGGKDQRRRNTRGFQCNDVASANVLAEWIEKIADVRLKVVNRAPANGPAIYVGSAAVEAGINLADIKSPTEEGLRIISDDQAKILIAGQSETATMKAVCRLLEELGC